MNKIQFTFEVVPCLILSLSSDDFFEGVHQVNTRGPELPTGGPDHTTRPKGHHSSQG